MKTTPNKLSKMNGIFRDLQVRRYQKQAVWDRRKIQENCEKMQHQLLVEMKANWPMEPTRDDRSVRHAVIARVEGDLKRTKASSSNLSNEELVRMAKRAQDDVMGAKELIADKAFKELRLKDYVVPEAMVKHKSLLSSHAQDKIKKRRWGVVDRFLTWYLGDYKSYQRPWEQKPESESTSNGSRKSAEETKKE
jgi:hypothetical protein